MAELEFYLSEDISISETFWSDESIPFIGFEDLSPQELVELLHVFVSEEIIEIAESWSLSPSYYLPPPEMGIELYTEPTPLLSLGIKPSVEATPQKEELSITLLGEILRGSGFSQTLEVFYSVGVDHRVTTTIQRWEWGTERWEIIPFSEQFLWWLNGMFIRFVHVHNGKIFLIVIPQDANSRLLCRIVVINAQTNPASVELVSDFWSPFPSNAGETFGNVAVGHGFLAFCRLGDFILFNMETYEWERYRAIFLSSQYRKLIDPQVRHLPVIVPEGILLLPVGIFFDLETYHQLPHINLSTTADYALLEAERLILVELPKNRSEGEATITKAYLWNSPAIGFERIDVEADLNLSPYAVWGQGAYWNGKWIAYGADKADLDERLLYLYSLEEGKLKVSHAGYRNLPLSAAAQIFRYMPNYAQPYWLEMFFQTVGNLKYVYTVRLWNRVYRLDLENKSLELATLVPVWNGNEYEFLTPEIPVQTLLSYDLATGQLYAIARYGYQNYITIVRQEDVPSEPPAPTDVSVNFNQRQISFVPAVFAYPQEFVVTIEHLSAQVKFEMFSWKCRQLWEVSYDGGINWQPMTSPILRANPSDNIVIRVTCPQQLLRNTDYRVKVRAVSTQFT